MRGDRRAQFCVGNASIGSTEDLTDRDDVRNRVAEQAAVGDYRLSGKRRSETADTGVYQGILARVRCRQLIQLRWWARLIKGCQGA